MVHIILIYYVISFTSGVAALILAGMLSLKYKGDLLRWYILFLIVLMIFILLNMYQFYRFRIIPQQVFSPGLVVNILFFLCFGMLSYIAPIISHYLVGRVISRRKKIVFASIAGLSVVLILFAFLFRHNPADSLKFILKIQYSGYTYLFFAVLIYSIFVLVRSLNTLKEKDLKEIVLAAIIITLIGLPGFVIDANWSLFQDQWKIVPKVFNFLPLFYLIWNAVTIWIAAKFIFVRDFNDGRVESINIDADFIRQFNISERETEITRLIVDGLSNPEIAKKLFISLGTVKNHVYHIYQKTGADNRIELLNLIRKARK